MNSLFRLRLSLKYALGLVFLAALVCAYLLHQARIRRDAVAAAEKALGISIQIEDNAPQWLVPLLGREAFHRMPDIIGVYDLTTDNHLAAFARLPELRSLSTNHTWAGSDVATFELDDCSAMESFPLISDAGIGHLAGASRLERLSLYHTAVTDEGIVRLRGMTSLKSLGIVSARITDESIPDLLTLKSLESLSVVGTSITPEGVRRLESGLPNCKIRTQPSFRNTNTPDRSSELGGDET